MQMTLSFFDLYFISDFNILAGQLSRVFSSSDPLSLPSKWPKPNRALKANDEAGDINDYVSSCLDGVHKNVNLTADY